MIYVMLSMSRLSDVLYKLKRTGPRSDPCETPNGIYLRHDREEDILFLRYWIDKYQLNHRRLKFLAHFDRELRLIVFLQSTVVRDERPCWIYHHIWRQIVKWIGQAGREGQL